MQRVLVMPIIAAVMVFVLSVGCVSQTAMTMPKGYEGRVCWVMSNNNVRMADFEPRLICELKSRGFDARPFAGLLGSGNTNDLVVTYVANRTFNLFTCYPHLSYAKIMIANCEKSDMIANGTFRQRGGPFSLAFSSLMRCARSKMRPVFAQMFANYPRKSDEEF